MDARKSGASPRGRALRRIFAASGGRGGSINPYDANAGQRLQIALGIQTIQDWVSRSPNYKPIRLLAACVTGTGKSFVTHSLTDLIRNLLGFDGDAKVFAHKGVAPFHVGGPKATGSYGYLQGRKRSAGSRRGKVARFA